MVELVAPFQALVVRSETKVTAKVIAAGSNLKVVGRAGVGVDNIDVEAASERGVLVVNAPTGNTVAAAEHTLALMLALARNVARGDASLRAGKWERSQLGVSCAGRPWLSWVWGRSEPRSPEWLRGCRCGWLRSTLWSPGSVRCS